jgi:hypothetical protein
MALTRSGESVGQDGARLGRFQTCALGGGRHDNVSIDDRSDDGASLGMHG